jgi:hypothetical protein
LDESVDLEIKLGFFSSQSRHISSTSCPLHSYASALEEHIHAKLLK